MNEQSLCLFLSYVFFFKCQCYLKNLSFLVKNNTIYFKYDKKGKVLREK